MISSGASWNCYSGKKIHTETRYVSSSKSPNYTFLYNSKLHDVIKLGLPVIQCFHVTSLHDTPEMNTAQSYNQLASFWFSTKSSNMAAPYKTLLHFAFSQIVVVARILSFILLFLFNALMWTLFVKSLRRCSSSAEATVANTGSNCICTVSIIKKK